MADINVGDRVRLGASTDNPAWVDGMGRFVGVSTLVRRVSDGGHYITVEADTGRYQWPTEACAIEARAEPERALEEAVSRFAPGARVRLGKHQPYGPEGETGWHPRQDQYVGRESVIMQVTREGTRDEDDEIEDLWVARVTADDGTYWWRQRNMTSLGGPIYIPTPRGTLTPSVPCANDPSNPRDIDIGDIVKLNKHRFWSVNHECSLTEEPNNWTFGMDPFIGRRATVLSRTNIGDHGRTSIKVDIDGSTYAWRCLDMDLVTKASGKAYPLLLGDLVKIVGVGRFEPQEMRDLLGTEARITSTRQRDGCYCIDSSTFLWDKTYLQRIEERPMEPEVKAKPPAEWMSHIRGWI